MGKSSEQPFELEVVLLRVLSNEATDAEIASLDQLLKESAQLRAEAARFLCDDSLMSDLFATQGEADDIVRSLVDGGMFAGRSRSRPTPTSPFRKAIQQVNRHGMAVTAAAAVLIVGLAVYTMALNSELSYLHRLAVIGADEQGAPGKPITDVAARDDERESKVIGRVSGLSHPVWAPDATPLKFGDRVRRGQTIALESGVVELLLSTGAKVTIEGPAQFEAHSALETILSRGRLAAAAPRVARGYTVVTPTAELVDIGTQFGVVVEDTGDSELHVFDGDVVARSRLVSKGGALVHAKQDEAMRFVSSSPEPQRVKFREQQFVRQVTPLYEPSELPALPTTKSLVQWYAADMCKDVVDGGRVGTWGDLLIGDNNFADNAWQFDEVRRPLLVTDGAGRRTLRFDGWSSCLATSPMEPAAQQTVFVVCMPAPITYSNAGILYKYGEAPTLELGVRSDLSAYGWVWQGADKGAVAEVRSRPIDNERPAILAYQYDTANNKSKLWLNGVLQGMSDAPVAVLQSGQRYIGSHSDPHQHAAYFGNLYEVVVFDSVFNDEQLQAFWDYFSHRYKLNL